MTDIEKFARDLADDINDDLEELTDWSGVFANIVMIAVSLAAGFLLGVMLS